MEHEAIALAARQKIRELDAAIEEQKAKKQKTVVEPLQQKREDDFDTDTINNAFQQVITIMQLPLLARHDLHGLEPDQVVALKYVAETSRTPDEFRLVRVNKNHFQGGRQVIRLTIGSDEIEKEKALKYLYEHVEDAYLVRGGLEEFLDKFQGIMAETSSALQLVTPGMSAPLELPYFEGMPGHVEPAAQAVAAVYSNVEVPIQIFVNNLAVGVYPSNDVAALREFVAAKYVVPKDDLRMAFCGKELQDGYLLSHYNIQKHSNVQAGLMDAGLGGAPPIAGDPLILTLTYSYSYLLL